MAKLAWQEIQTVWLDMDGTLLDLHFDNHFWNEYVPAKLADKTGQSLAQAHAYMNEQYAKVHGTIKWYCLDYWTDLLDLDIVAAKREVDHLISLRADSVPFISALKQTGREVRLLTNAHPDALSLKVEKTKLDQHIDLLVSTHEFGVSKESQSLWQAVAGKYPFDGACTLFVDDSLPILAAAQTFGIKHLLAVANPDSHQGSRKITGFPAVDDLTDLLAAIHQQPIKN